MTLVLGKGRSQTSAIEPTKIFHDEVDLGQGEIMGESDAIIEFLPLRYGKGHSRYSQRRCRPN